MKEGGGRRDSQREPEARWGERRAVAGRAAPSRSALLVWTQRARSPTLGSLHHPSRLPQCGPCRGLQGRWEGLAVSPDVSLESEGHDSSGSFLMRSRSETTSH